MKPLFVTPFDIKTKKCTGPGVLLPTTNTERVPDLLGKLPDVHTKNTMIFNQPNDQALCVSWIRFSI